MTDKSCCRDYPCHTGGEEFAAATSCPPTLSQIAQETIWRRHRVFFLKSTSKFPVIINYSHLNFSLSIPKVLIIHSLRIGHDVCLHIPFSSRGRSSNIPAAGFSLTFSQFLSLMTTKTIFRVLWLSLILLTRYFRHHLDTWANCTCWPLVVE